MPDWPHLAVPAAGSLRENMHRSPASSLDLAARTPGWSTPIPRWIGSVCRDMPDSAACSKGEAWPLEIILLLGLHSGLSRRNKAAVLHMDKLTFPALKNAVIRSDLKHRSVAHMPHRNLPGCIRSLSGIKADSRRGSSSAAVWLLTVMRPWWGGRLRACCRFSSPWMSVCVKRLIKPLLRPPTAPSTAPCKGRQKLPVSFGSVRPCILDFLLTISEGTTSIILQESRSLLALLHDGIEECCNKPAGQKSKRKWSLTRTRESSPRTSRSLPASCDCFCSQTSLLCSTRAVQAALNLSALASLRSLSSALALRSRPRSLQIRAFGCQSHAENLKMHVQAFKCDSNDYDVHALKKCSSCSSPKTGVWTC